MLYQIVTSFDNINCELGFTFNFVVLHYKLGSILKSYASNSNVVTQLFVG